MGEMIALTMADGVDVPVYRAPAPGRRKGGIVFLHEIFGITERVRTIADVFAGHDYEVLVPALFHRIAPGFSGDHAHLEEAAEIALRRHPFDQSVADMLSCVDALRPHGPVFLTGFCYGGSLAYKGGQLRDDVAAVSSFYGAMVPSFAGDPVHAPTICHYGRRDPYIPLAGVEALIAARPEVTTYLYDAGHGFVFGEVDDNPAAAELALTRTFDLFDRHAAGTGAAGGRSG